MYPGTDFFFISILYSSQVLVPGTSVHGHIAHILYSDTTLRYARQHTQFTIRCQMQMPPCANASQLAPHFEEQTLMVSSHHFHLESWSLGPGDCFLNSKRAAPFLLFLSSSSLPIHSTWNPALEIASLTALFSCSASTAALGVTVTCVCAKAREGGGGGEWHVRGTSARCARTRLHFHTRNAPRMQTL